MSMKRSMHARAHRRVALLLDFSLPTNDTLDARLGQLLLSGAHGVATIGTGALYDRGLLGYKIRWS